VRRLQNILRGFARHPRYTVMRGAGRFAFVRKVITDFRQLLHRHRLSEYLGECKARMHRSVFPQFDKKEFVSSLQETGVAFGLQLPARTVEEVRNYAEQWPCFADGEPAHGFMLRDRAEAEARLGKPILVAQYFNITEECPAVAMLVEDPILQWVAGAYLRSVPSFVGANLWWTFPVDALEEDRDRHAHLYHRDVDDFSFLKFFFYLTDVKNGEGAHICVINSHRRPPRLRIIVGEFGGTAIVRSSAATRRKGS
jgi:hypothetical protein